MSEETSEDPQTDLPTGEANSSEDEELEGMMSSIRKAERRQKVRAALYAVAAIVLIVVAIYAFFAYRDELFVPKVDMDEAGEMAWEKTNDPQCRELIAEVTAVGEDYYEYESVIEEELLGDDPDKIREIKRRLDALEVRLNKAETLSEKAELRYEDSARQLDEWFEYVDNEIGFVEDIADERLAELEAEAADDTADAGTSEKGADAGILVHSPDAGAESDDEEPTKSAEERRDGALIALHDAFQNFRVWHSANAHPCGSASEGETPWRPDEGAGSQGSESPSAPSE